jgi:hypothetical protein
LWALSATGKEPEVIEPPFSQFVDRVLDEANPENDIEEQYQTRQKAVFQVCFIICACFVLFCFVCFV